MYVDEYFEKNLIKKKWSCGGTDNECKNGNGHLNCSEEYDTSCKISRLLNNHDKVFRHAAGQVEISYQKVDVSNYEIEKVEASGYSHIAGPNGTPGTLSKDANRFRRHIPTGRRILIRATSISPCPSGEAADKGPTAG